MLRPSRSGPDHPHGPTTDPAATIDGLRRGYRTLYKSGLTLEQARQELAAQADALPELRLWIDFLSVPGRGIVR